MNLKRIAVVSAATLLFSQLAVAQMMGGGGHTPSTPRTGTTPMTGSMSGAMGGMMGQSLVVGSDGTVFTLRGVPATIDRLPSSEVVAITPGGAIAWTTPVDGWMSQIEISGSLLYVTSSKGDASFNRRSAMAEAKSRVVALSTTTGASQWQRDLDGIVMDIESYSGGTYVIVVNPSFSMGGMLSGSFGMERTLVAIDNSGNILWTVELN